jgi:eukaryotic-like serine/threonine-protein kinase
MALAAGTKVGRYEIAALIGAGGMGEVYRAHDSRLRRDVAVKIIPISFAGDASRLGRFEQEARAAAALSHPDILAVYDIGTHEGGPYIVSELLEGESLRGRLKAGPLPIRKTIDYALQVARGLTAAHNRGIVHRDLKPDNIFITREGVVKILDFGLAKLIRPPAAMDDSTQTVRSDPGAIVGTVGYMSPEQVRGKETDARSDIFSLGAVIYEMIAGRRAFSGDSSADVLSAILKEDPPELAETNPNVSPALDRIVRHCLEKNPAERLQSAHDLAFCLETLSTTSQIPKPISMPESKKHTWLWAAAIAVLLVAAAAAFLLGRVTRPRVTLDFDQLTYRSGTVYQARFNNDGSSLLFSAAWDGKPLELFTSRYGSVESRSLAPQTLVAAISSKNQAAVLLQPKFLVSGLIPLPLGTLAILSDVGGAPRPLLQNVEYADWTPDGADLAVIKADNQDVLRRNELQFPIDKTIYRPQRGWISHVRFSPNGKYLAIAEHVPFGDDGKLVVVDRNGKKVAESPFYSSINGSAWANDREVWYTAMVGNGSHAVRAINLQGQTREVYRSIGDLDLYDIAPNGRVLLSADNARMLLFGGETGSADRDLSWLGWSLSAAISGDGSTVAFVESAQAVSGKSVTLVRKLDGSPPVKLGEGMATGLSPDGNWVATLSNGDPQNIVLLPMGVGKQVQLTFNGWSYSRDAHWMPNSAAILVDAIEPGHQQRVFLLDVASKELRPVLPEGVRGGFPSPDSQYVLGRDDEAPKIYTVSGKLVATLPKLGSDDALDGWAPDGKSIFVWNLTSIPRLDRVDISSGKRTPVGSISPPDSTGIVGFVLCHASKDGRTHAYSAFRLMNDLFVLNGLQ